MATRRQLLKFGAFTAATGLLQFPTGVLAASPGYGIEGRVAPELEIDYWIDSLGEPTSFRLADHQGKWVFLKCFQSWCPGCHSHGFPALKRISDAFVDNPDIAFAGIQTVFEGFYTNTVDKVRDIQLQYDLLMPMGHDPGENEGHPRTMRDYRTGGTPWMVLIAPDGRVVFNGFGIDVDRAIAFLQAQTA